VLRYYLDYDYETIARALDAKVGTVGSWLSRGLARLALVLDDSTQSLRPEDRPDGR
jgi:DNA-directed RNA polymerase specialized sigma24 family protein